MAMADDDLTPTDYTPEFTTSDTTTLTEDTPEEPSLDETSLEETAANDEVKLAAIAEPPPPVTVTASTAPGPVAQAPSLEGNIAATRIATLGGPAVTIEQPASAKTTSAKPDRSAARKRAARAKERPPRYTGS